MFWVRELAFSFQGLLVNLRFHVGVGLISILLLYRCSACVERCRKVLSRSRIDAVH